MSFNDSHYAERHLTRVAPRVCTRRTVSWRICPTKEFPPGWVPLWFVI